jgi:DNA-binding IclR family transcriptional regulator
MRGLELLETIDGHGSLTVTELARLTGTDKSVVSRMLSACEPDGWVVRQNGRISLGPRAALLAHSSASAEFVRQALPVVETISGVTGMPSQVYVLVGTRAVIVASAGGSLGITVGLGTSAPLFATAAGTVIASQLSEAELNRLLPPEPFPDAIADMIGNPGYAAFTAATFETTPRRSVSPDPVARSRGELDRRIGQIRISGAALDHGHIHPELGCVAVPWPRTEVHAALACMGSLAEVEDNEDLALAVLRAAAAPGATRADVVAAAAATSSALTRP